MTPHQKRALKAWHDRPPCQSRAHCDACKSDPAWRAKAIPGWDNAKAPPCPRPGLGDAVAWLIRVTGIKRVAKKQTGCGGCAKRQAALNSLSHKILG